LAKKLVAYFSASGVTRKAAEALAKAVGADLYEIKPEVPYTQADLNWQDDKARSTVEMRDKAFRPPLADAEADIAAYDVVFVGFPIWWYVAPTIINTFLEAYDFSGKTIVPFATSGSSGIADAAEGLRASAGAAATVAQGKMLNGEQSPEALAAWAESLGL
jgi:flavodoxin